MLEILKQQSILYLMMTDSCDLNCDYCLSKKERDQLKNSATLMDSRIAKAAITKWVDLENKEVGIKRLVIVFYGGEPLLNPQGIFDSLNFLKKLEEIGQFGEKSLEKVIITNGTLIAEIPDALLDLIKTTNTVVTVSLDGTQSVHDLYRKHRNGKGSFEKTFRGLSVLKKREIETCLSVTLTPANFDKADGLIQIANYFGIKEIGANPLIGIGYSFIKEEMAPKEYSQKAARASVAYFNKAKSLGIREDRVGRMASALKNSLSCLDCFAYGKQLVVWSNGDMGICHAMKNTVFGNTNTTVNDISSKIKQLADVWLQRLPIFHKECHRCEAKKICGGGCAFSSIVLNKNFLAKDRLACEYTKEVYRLIA